MNTNKINKIKKEFIQNYFTSKTIYDGDSRIEPNKLVDAIYVAKEEKSNSYMQMLYKRYNHNFKYSYNDYASAYMFTLNELVMQYKPKNKNFDWNELNTEGSEEAKQLHAYLTKANQTGMSAIEWYIVEVLQFNNWEKQEQNKVLKLDMMSFEQLTNNNDDEQRQLLEATITQLNPTVSGYKAPHFKEWFLDYIEEQKSIKRGADLTKKLTEYYDNAKFSYAGELIADDLKALGVSLSKANEYVAEGVNFHIEQINKNLKEQKKKQLPLIKAYSNKSSDNYNKQIKEIAENAYKIKHNGLRTFTFAQIEAIKERAILQEAQEIVENERYGQSYINKQLSNWILENHELNTVEEAVYEQVSDTARYDFIDSYFANKQMKKSTLYEIYYFISLRLDELDHVITPTKEIKEDTKEEVTNEGFTILNVSPNGTRARIKI